MLLITDSFDVVKYRAWSVDHGPLPPAENYRCYVRGRFTATAPVWFLALDHTNGVRRELGIPPIPDYAKPSVGDGITPTTVLTECEASGGVYAFIEPDTHTPGWPTSRADLGMIIIHSLAQASQPPALVTADLWAEQECFCTTREAVRH